LSDSTVHQLKVERKGGLAGFGQPNSRIRSVGSVDLRALSPTDRQAIENLFARGTPQTSPTGPVEADPFEYHLTMTTPDGDKTVVVPEREVPGAVRDAVHDEMI